MSDDRIVHIIGSHQNYAFPSPCLGGPWGNTTLGKMVMRWGSALQWCHDAILRYEQKAKTRVDTVVFSRPDLFMRHHIQPLRAWWDGNASLHHCKMQHNTPVCDDQLWIATRDVGMRFLNTYNTILNCSQICSPPATCWTSRGSCCNRNEYVLAYSGFPLGRRAPRDIVNTLRSASVIVRTEDDLHKRNKCV